MQQAIALVYPEFDIIDKSEQVARECTGQVVFISVIDLAAKQLDHFPDL